MPSIARYINVISRCGNMYRNNRLRDTDLTVPHLPYLFAVCRSPGISQEQLARRIYVNKSNVTRSLTALEKNGYIERRPSETDKRVLLVFPTPRAQDMLPRLRELTQDWNAMIAQDLSEEELELFRSMLSRIAERATGVVDEGDFE